MDNVTHSLTGLALARAGLSRFCPRATLLLILSSNAPDSDIVAAFRGSLRYLEVHRGYSHSLLCLPLMAVLPVLVVAGIYRQRLPWARAWALCCIGVAGHLLLDLTNSYGVRLLLPFSSSWFHEDLNTLYDGSIMAVLVFVALWPGLARLVSWEIGDRASQAAGYGRGTARFALLFIIAFDGGRAVLHQRAVAQLQARLYDGMPPLDTAALPNPFNPFRWMGVVESSRSYRLLDVNTLGELDPEAARIFYKPAKGPALESAKATAPFRYFLYFARFPVWSEEPVTMDTDRGTRLDLSDLRFGTPGAGSFHCIALENGADQILESRFTYGSGSDLGWGRGQGR
ncbi:MAG: metal-dependent hydrolase [Bryobacteraceae bacterium]